VPDPSLTGFLVLALLIVVAAVLRARRARGIGRLVRDACGRRRSAAALAWLAVIVLARARRRSPSVRPSTPWPGWWRPSPRRRCTRSGSRHSAPGQCCSFPVDSPTTSPSGVPASCRPWCWRRRSSPRPGRWTRSGAGSQ
jgi:hypothetical protein